MVVLTSFSPPTEGIKHQQPTTKLVVDGREVGIGTLYIAESTLAWKNNSTGEGISLPYPHIGVHAVSRDINRFGSECLYMVVDSCLDDDFDINEESEENEDDYEKSKEIVFVPDDKGQLEAMYVAMTFCQSLHPCENQLSDDEYVDADFSPVEGEPNTNEHSESNGTNIHLGEDMETEGQFLDAEDIDAE